jgi:hypothetical protein
VYEETPHTGMVWGGHTSQYNLGPEGEEGFFVGTEHDYGVETGNPRLMRPSPPPPTVR